MTGTEPGGAADRGIEPERLQIDPFESEAAARAFARQAWLGVAGGAVALIAVGFGLGVAVALWRGWA